MLGGTDLLPTDPRRILHDAARRFCAAAAHVAARRAILREVERFVPADFADAAALRDVLALAGGGSDGPFAAFIRTARVEDHAAVPPLPYRRVLGEAERAARWRGFEAVWGRWYGGCGDRADVPPFVTLHEDVMEAPDARGALRRALVGRGETRVLDFRELEESHEIDVAAAGFHYNGAEGVTTAPPYGWMVCASHESSITFGGQWLIDAVRPALDFDRFAYRGWEPALYGQK